MRKSKLLLPSALAMLLSAEALAATSVTMNTTVDWYNDPTFAQVPGQALSQISNLGNTGGVLLPGSTASTTNCVVFPDPNFGCQGPAGPVTQHYGLTAASGPASGVVATGSGNAGNDAVGVSIAASSDGAVIAGTSALLYNIVGIDRQRVSFDVAAGGLPEFIDIDVTFSVIASITDNSTVAGATYLANASANVHILEAGTLLAAPYTTGPMLAPLVAVAFVNNSGGELSSSLVNVTETISVRPNAEYWVALESQVALSLVPSPGFFDRDYAGLDIELSAYADPTFTLNPAFAAANPAIANALQINRTAVVPLPAALPLTVLALAGLVTQRRRKTVA